VKKRIAVRVNGIVQGVGFRPFLHRLAAELGVQGWVRNTAFGVELQCEGEKAALHTFTARLRTDAPPFAVLEEITVSPPMPPAGYIGFEIRPSLPGAHDTLVSPDLGICPDCLRELRAPADRRYRYPFLNCTNCGPRFSIVKTVPYDRANTTMASFRMCPACAAEYADPANRRYHAQPDCCPVCGPHLQFLDAAGRPAAGDAIALAQALLRRGGILAVKGLGGFHLACTTGETAVRRLRAAKHREEKPLAVMCPDVDAAQRLCTVSTAEAAMLQSFRKPIVLLQKRRPTELSWLSANASLGVLLPYTPLHVLLFDPPAGADGRHFVFPALVMTSANLSDCPVVTDNAEAVRTLSGVADGFLVHDRAIEARCDDSLLRVLEFDGGKPYFLRRSRGFVPQPIALAADVSGILALGAEQKASFVLGKGHYAFASQHIGDLKNAETLAHYRQQTARFEKLFGAPVRALACDLHPDYLSTRTAQERAAREHLALVPVQHHHAHFAACLADNRLAGDCIGIVWDGTGLGTDGTIWGGEFLTGDYARAVRAVSMRPILLPGGDAAIREIGRIGFSLAWDAGAPAACALPPRHAALFSAMLQKRLNCPASSGMGRLFDGVYALLTGRAAVSYEGQAAELLEALAEGAAQQQGKDAGGVCAGKENPEAAHTPDSPGGSTENADGPQPCPAPGAFSAADVPEPAAMRCAVPLPAAYTPQFYAEGALLRWDTRPLIRAVLADREAGVPLQTIALRFHESLAAMALAACREIRRRTGLGRVVLSGGVFFNQILLRRIREQLAADGFAVYHHCRVSTGDEGIALGQMAVAAARRAEWTPAE
jgi:hydrogenase maturation protein HypF